ncbi:glycosyltransferase [Brevibacillus sp. GCM10020057]|uniref:glycosyltransferase n=1 Tax=Brevibacillus sp. GCM10020057 TaxID=3317327 RepID=UPI00363A0A68
MANEKRNRPGTARKDKGITLGDQIENQERLSVIISVQQDENTIRRLLRQVEKLMPKEIILIIHGSRDRSIDRVLEMSHPLHVCFIYPFPLGEELWRAIGAKEATGDIWLFLSGDTIIQAEDLAPFIRACYRGADIAMRKASVPASGTGTVGLAKMYVNSLLEQERLGMSSMSELPLAMTVQAATSIGVDLLFLPPLVQMMAMQRGLNIEAVPMRPKAILAKKRLSAQAIRAKEMTCLGDHLEAIAYWNEQRDLT